MDLRIKTNNNKLKGRTVYTGFNEVFTSHFDCFNSCEEILGSYLQLTVQTYVSGNAVLISALDYLVFKYYAETADTILFYANERKEEDRLITVLNRYINELDKLIFRQLITGNSDYQIYNEFINRIIKSYMLLVSELEKMTKIIIIKESQKKTKQPSTSNNKEIIKKYLPILLELDIDIINDKGSFIGKRRSGAKGIIGLFIDRLVVQGIIAPLQDKDRATALNQLIPNLNTPKDGKTVGQGNCPKHLQDAYKSEIDSRINLYSK